MAPPGSRTHEIVAAALAFAAALLLAACGAGGEDAIDPGNAADAPDYSEAIAAAPPKLAALYADGDALIEGGLGAFERQIAALEGLPIVVNKWASWCGPCRAEFPHLQSQAAEHADEIAFIGIDSDDSLDAARTFLDGHPVPYPSFYDPDSEIAGSLDLLEFPATAFIGADGAVLHIRRGVYSSEQELAADIEKFALG